MRGCPNLCRILQTLRAVQKAVCRGFDTAPRILYSKDDNLRCAIGAVGVPDAAKLALLRDVREHRNATSHGGSGSPQVRHRCVLFVLLHENKLEAIRIYPASIVGNLPYFFPICLCGCG